MMKKTFAVLMMCGTSMAWPDTLNSYMQTNLTSDLPGVAAQEDPHLVNPWGIVAGPTSPFWISDNGTGFSTLYNGAGKPASLIVTVPPPAGSAGPGRPTGIAFNGSNSFGGASFLFATTQGTISSWTSGQNTVLQATVPGSAYTGLAIGNNGSADFLYAANFRAGRIDTFDSHFAQTMIAGGFTDPTLPAGYAPFNIQNLGGKLYVTYALQNSSGPGDLAGIGHGFVNVFDTNGNLLQRLTSEGALNSPWGLALASSQFGAFSGDLLIGNFGDGLIHAYDPNSGAFMGTLDDLAGNPIQIEGLWGLSFGNGAQGQDLNALYFTAGIPGPNGHVEDHGLFGAITETPEPGALLLMSLGLGSIFWLYRKRVWR
jgi:uncharacterized protein (TIGR03118 family)